MGSKKNKLNRGKLDPGTEERGGGSRRVGHGVSRTAAEAMASALEATSREDAPDRSATLSMLSIVRPAFLDASRIRYRVWYSHSSTAEKRVRSRCDERAREQISHAHRADESTAPWSRLRPWRRPRRRGPTNQSRWVGRFCLRRGSCECNFVSNARNDSSSSSPTHAKGQCLAMAASGAPDADGCSSKIPSTLLSARHLLGGRASAGCKEWKRDALVPPAAFVRNAQRVAQLLRARLCVVLARVEEAAQRRVHIPTKQ